MTNEQSIVPPEVLGKPVVLPRTMPSLEGRERPLWPSAKMIPEMAQRPFPAPERHSDERSEEESSQGLGTNITIGNQSFTKGRFLSRFTPSEWQMSRASSRSKLRGTPTVLSPTMPSLEGREGPLWPSVKTIHRNGTKAIPYARASF
jgi:hypothetical protein